MELFPRQRIVFVADAKEATKAQDGVGDAAAALFENNAFDRADLLAVGAIDVRPFNLIAGDEAWGILDIWVLTGTGFMVKHDKSPLECVMTN